MPDPDPRDDLLSGAEALRALTQLMYEMSSAKVQFEAFGPGDMAELLGLIDERLHRSANIVAHYIPHIPRE